MVLGTVRKWKREVEGEEEVEGEVKGEVEKMGGER